MHQQFHPYGIFLIDLDYFIPISASIFTEKMILIPQRLFESPQVTTILRDGNVCILQKELTEPVVKREGYISNHVVSIVLAGEQQIRTYDENLIRVKQGEVLFIPRGMYYITDLLPKDGTFKSLLFILTMPLFTNFYLIPKSLKFLTKKFGSFKVWACSCITVIC